MMFVVHAVCSHGLQNSAVL